MKFKRRELVKIIGAAPVALGYGGASAVLPAQKLLVSPDVAQVDKSIKAGFGGSFSVRSHVESNNTVYADIEHRGNRYFVAAADLYDWKIISSSLKL